MMSVPRPLRGILLIIGLLAVWELVARAVGVPILVPTVPQLLEGIAAIAASGDLLRHLWASTSRLLVGLLVGVPLGAGLGCAMGRFPLVDAALNPFVRMFNAIPALALVPFSLLWFGATELSRYAILIYTITLTVLLSARLGAATLPAIRERIASSLGLSRRAIFLRVVIPSCFPAILAGARTALGLGVMVIVAAEMLGAESGFGYLIMQARSHFNMVNMLIGVLGLGALSLSLDRLFAWTIDHYLPRWSVARRT